MIMSKTPLRISFVGGGSDLSNFYRHEIGAVISTSINKYVYVVINKKFDNSIRVSYSKTEEVLDISELQHPLVKALLSLFDVKKSIEVISLADVHSNGTGLGSSSSFTVGLANALSTYLKKNISKEKLAEIACNVEIDICKAPIGKQDQYAAAYGGLNLIEFKSNGKVDVSEIKCTDLTLKKFKESLLILYTGKSRAASSVLDEQMLSISANNKILNQMVKLSYNLKQELENGNLENIGLILHENWYLKKNLAKNISNHDIDNLYEIGLKSGATGGKILGAGNGGFFLFFADKVHHKKIAQKTGLKQMIFDFDKFGSRIILKD